MTRARCLVTIDGALVVTSDVTGKRYVFTPARREQEIDDCDAGQFDAKTVSRSVCGCTGGKGQSVVIKVFEVLT